MALVLDGSLGVTFPVTAGSASAVQASSGRVLQVVQVVYSTYTEVKSTSFTDSGLTASITPSSSSSKILILLNPIVRVYRATNVGVHGSMNIVRGSTQIHQADAPEITAATGSSGYQVSGAGNSIIYLDSPSTTSSTTYKMQMKIISTANDGTIGLNNYMISSGDSKSTITLMEIAA